MINFILLLDFISPWHLFLVIPLVFISLVFIIIAQWYIYEKANQPGWACIIPIYNLLILLKIIGKPWWWIFLFCIPYLNIIWFIWSYNLLSKSFGKDEGFTIGIIFLPFIFLSILGFGEAKYIGLAGNNFNEPKL